MTGWIRQAVHGAVAVVALTFAVDAAAADFRPGLAFDTGGIRDKGFNEAAYAGADRFRRETGQDFRYQAIQRDGDEAKVLTTMAQGGIDPIIAVSFAYADAVAEVAPKFPNTRFVVIDGVATGPNIQSILFREQEGAFLVGALAAMKSTSHKLGFVGGMDIPIIRKFACGYTAGARKAVADTAVVVEMIGTTPDAWRDTAKAGTIAKDEMAKGADVLFAAAGFAGLGVLDAAADAGKFGIGVDSNQNDRHPGKVLTSMLKRLDVVTYDLLSRIRAGNWTPGLTVRGLADGGIGWALDDNNRALVTDEMKAVADELAQQIVAGALVVPETATTTCQ